MTSCMMHHVFIMFLWCVFIDELHDDNSSHVFTIVFIMYDTSCIHHVFMACIHRQIAWWQQFPCFHYCIHQVWYIMYSWRVFIHHSFIQKHLQYQLFWETQKCLHDENIDENTSRWVYGAGDHMKTLWMFPWYLYGNEYMISSLATVLATEQSRRLDIAVAGSARPWLLFP